MSKVSRQFDIGQQVMAKWPKSSLYFKGKILDYNESDYLVQFDDEGKSEYPIKFKNVQLQVSKARSRSHSRGRSPGRKKSPARKTPTRKSPGRPTQSPSRTTVAGSTEIQNISLRTRAAKAVVEKPAPVPTVTGRRQSARLADKSGQSGKFKVNLTSILESVRSENKVYRTVKRGAFALWSSATSLIVPLLLVLTPFVLSLMCTAKNCSFSWVEFPQKFSSYYDQKAVTYSLGCLAILFVLSLVPLGKTVKTKGGHEVRCNGFLTLITLILVAIAALWKQYNVSPIYLLFRHFLVTFSVFGFLLSLAVYIKSFFVPKSSLYTKGNTGYYIVDFVKGRELNPKIRGFDIKFFVCRLATSLIIILNFVIVLKDLQAKHGQYSPTLLTCCGIQIFYGIDMLIFEDSFFSMFEYLKQGTGFISIGGFISCPFLLTVYSRFILNHGSELPWYHLVITVLVSIFSYAMYRGSASQRHAFKVNPNDPALAQLESLPAANGKRLLISGWFGRVRHPDCLAEIISQLSLASLCGFTIYVPQIVTVLFICCVLAKVVLDEKSSKSEYGLAWNNYVTRVPYRLIPKVF